MEGVPTWPYRNTTVPIMSHRTTRGAVVFGNISINFPKRIFVILLNL